MIVTAEMYNAIHEHAILHYNDATGWDMVVECMGLADVQEVADRWAVADFAALFAAVEADAALWAEINDDIRGA